MSKQIWRLLEDGERIEAGDEYYARNCEWRRTSVRIGEQITQNCEPMRRREVVADAVTEEQPAPAPNANVPTSAADVGAACGITPRQLYAAAALARYTGEWFSDTAQECFSISDAMLAAEKERT